MRDFPILKRNSTLRSSKIITICNHTHIIVDIIMRSALSKVDLDLLISLISSDSPTQLSDKNMLFPRTGPSITAVSLYCVSRYCFHRVPQVYTEATLKEKKMPVQRPGVYITAGWEQYRPSAGQETNFFFKGGLTPTGLTKPSTRGSGAPYKPPWAPRSQSVEARGATLKILRNF